MEYTIIDKYKEFSVIVDVVLFPFFFIRIRRESMKTIKGAVVVVVVNIKRIYVHEHEQAALRCLLVPKVVAFFCRFLVAEISNTYPSISNLLIYYFLFFFFFLLREFFHLVYIRNNSHIEEVEILVLLLLRFEL